MSAKSGLDLLREPFPEHLISKKPQATKKQNEELKSNYSVGIKCKVCGQWHHKDAIHLDYVGHAALTHRLLDADPLWNWEPQAYNDGLPKYDDHGGLWIKLTVCGVTRLGYGNAESSTFKDIGSREKEVIGDALRNAAMRFGAALELWHKGQLHDEEDLKHDDKKEKPDNTIVTRAAGTSGESNISPKVEQAQSPEPSKGFDTKPNSWQKWTPSDPQLNRLFALSKKAMWTKEQVTQYMKENMGINSSSELNKEQYDWITHLMNQGKTYEQSKNLGHVYQT